MLPEARRHLNLGDPGSLNQHPGSQKNWCGVWKDDHAYKLLIGVQLRPLKKYSVSNRSWMFFSLRLEKLDYNRKSPCKMPSQESQQITDLYNKLNTFLRREGLDIELYRILMEEVSSVGAEPTDVTYEEVKCPGTI